MKTMYLVTKDILQQIIGNHKSAALLFPLNPEIDLISLRFVHHPTEYRPQSKAAAAAHDRSQFLTFLLSTRSRQRRKLRSMEMISVSSAATMTDVCTRNIRDIKRLSISQKNLAKTLNESLTDSDVSLENHQAGFTELQTLTGFLCIN